MSWDRHPIQDYYGQEIKVEPIMASPGPMIDLDLRLADTEDAATDGRFDYLRLSPDQARLLADKLVSAAEGATPTGKEGKR